MESNSLASPEAVGRISQPELRGRKERKLLKAARAGEPEALEAIVRLHWRETHRAVFLLLGDEARSEDVTQEAMLSALRSLDSFDGRGSLRGWIHRIAVNRALDLARAEGARPQIQSGADPDRLAASGPEAGLPEAVAAALMTLDPQERVLIVLRHALGYRATEVGALLGVPAATVRSRLHRALDQVRRKLEAGEHDDD